MTLSKNNRIENKSGQTLKCLVARIVNAFKSVVACGAPLEYLNRELPLTSAKRGKG